MSLFGKRRRSFFGALFGGRRRSSSIFDLSSLLKPSGRRAPRPRKSDDNGAATGREPPCRNF